VHSDTVFRSNVVRELKGYGYRFVAAVPTAKAALDLLEDNRVDLVIADDDLDDMDVWAFARTLRSGTLYPHAIPMIVMAQPRTSAAFRTIAEDLGVRLYRGKTDGKLEAVIASSIEQQPTRTVLVIDDDAYVGEIVQAGLGPYYRIETGLKHWRH
jgi:CheY-like chemotaxis protein